MSDLQALLKRVEGAIGSDRRLDLAIAEALGQHFAFTDNPPAKAGGEWCPSNISCGKVTSSVDAALALVARVLPGWGYDITYRAAWGNHTACVIANDRRAKPHTAAGATAALALVASILRARLAEEGK